MRLLVLVVVALALLAPIALADHVFSHRVYVVGRVVDVAGLPVAGSAVMIEPSFRVGGKCYDSADEVTRSHGDFKICRHTHGIPANASIRMSVEGVERNVSLDPDLRLVAVNVQLLNPAPTIDFTGVREFNQSYLVAGRHFAKLAGPVEVENVHVNATPIRGNVSVSLLVGAEEIATAEGDVTEHGDFEISISLGEVPEGAIVRVVSGREIVEEPASPLFRRTDVQLVRDTRLASGPGEDAPGTAPVPLAAWTLALAVLLGAVAAQRTQRR